MPVEDVLDIKAYLKSLPPVSSPGLEAGIPIAFLLRRGLGLWKFLGLDTAPWQPDGSQTATWNRGSYLVNGPGHCGECHTPRNLIMARDGSRFMMGGPHPEGQGKVPSLHAWSKRGGTRTKKAGPANGEVLYKNMSSAAWAGQANG
jgi:mono/diheme cytochrome c family protein